MGWGDVNLLALREWVSPGARGEPQHKGFQLQAVPGASAWWLPVPTTT